VKKNIHGEIMFGIGLIGIVSGIFIGAPIWAALIINGVIVLILGVFAAFAESQK
jgi:hypothetical protein